MTKTSNEDDPLQVRLTFMDTIRAQKKLDEYLYRLRKHNDFIHVPECEDFIRTVNSAFLSQGQWRLCYLDAGNTKIPLSGCHTLCLKLAHIHRNNVKVKRYSFEQEVPISRFWDLIIQETYFIYPAALEESLKISGEHPKREDSQAYDFTSRRSKEV